MHHIHLETCHSTQLVIKEELKKTPSEKILVSTENQTHGRGRREKNWSHYKGSLAFSFNLKAAPIETLTSLEIAVIIRDFFKHYNLINLSFKWPNDLIFKEKKVGGILFEKAQGQLICGLGINLIETSDVEDFPFEAGFLFEKKNKSLTNKKLSYTITDFIHQNRITHAASIRDEWNHSCFHKDQNVLIVDEKNLEGKFIGINDWGAALIEGKEGIKTVYSGSLFFDRLSN